MTDTLITKSQAVMDRIDTAGATNSVTFDWRYDDTKDLLQRVTMTTQQWEELGSPDQITVTVTPGDTLPATR